MKRDVGDMLTTLIRNQAGREAPETAAGAPGELTALGLTPMRLGERHVAVDLSRSRIFRNLNTFVSLLADEVIEQCAFGIADVMVRRKVDPRLTPELAAAGLDWVTIYVRLDAAEGLPFNHRSFSKRLQEMESRLKLAGSYTLSRQFTPLDGADVIDRALTEEPDFLSGMRLAAGHLFFFKEIDAARRANRQLLLVEDGGYLAPLINRFCLEGKTLGDVFDDFRLPPPPEARNMPLADWLAPFYRSAVRRQGHLSSGRGDAADLPILRHSPRNCGRSGGPAFHAFPRAGQAAAVAGKAALRASGG